jgi:hypothetical protein
MLAPVSIDEYVNYRLVTSMTSGGSPRELLSNLFFFDGDVDLLAYGYPFWSTSALAILPVNVLLKAGLIEECHRTTADILILRQLNPFLLSLTIVLLIYLWTGFRFLIRSVFLFVLLASIPVVFGENLQHWHPDGLATFLAVLTIFTLFKDRQRFGKWYYLSAVFCGLATGTKLIGMWFFLCVAVYVFLGCASRRKPMSNPDASDMPIEQADLLGSNYTALSHGMARPIKSATYDVDPGS